VGPGKGLAWELRSGESTPRSGRPSGQKSLPVAREKGFTRRGCLLPSRTCEGGGRLLFTPAAQVPLASAAPDPRGRDQGQGRPATWGPDCRLGRQAGAPSRGPYGPTAQDLEAGAHFALFWFYPKWPVLYGGGRAEAVSPTRAKGRPPPVQRGRPAAPVGLKFKCDPRRGRRQAAAREGPRAPLKGQYVRPAGPALFHVGKRPRTWFWLWYDAFNSEAAPGDRGSDLCVCVRAFFLSCHLCVAEQRGADED
jgi:hypothetical protein